MMTKILFTGLALFGSALLMAESCPVNHYLAWGPQAACNAGWCCPNGTAPGTIPCRCGGVMPQPSVIPQSPIPTWNQTSTPIFTPGQGLNEVTSCVNSIVGSIPVAGTVANALQGVFNLRLCLQSATTPDLVNNCLSAACNAYSAALPGAPTPAGCTANGYLGMYVSCTQFSIALVTNYAIPNTMQRLNTGLFSGCISQGSCTSCKRCCGAFGDSGSNNDDYYRCLSSCANIQGGINGYSWACRRQQGIPLGYDRSVDSPCIDDYANWTPGICR